MKSRYVELMSKFETHNRPPGGIIALNRLVSRWPQSDLPVIDAGCNSGYTSLELARMTGRSVMGVDISESMILAAKTNSAKFHGAVNVEFSCQDINKFSPEFKDNIVFSGGSTVFTRSWKDTVGRYVKLSGEMGFCSELWFTYRELPPVSLQIDLADILGFEVPIVMRGDMTDHFSGNGMELIDVFYMPAEVPRYNSHEEITEFFLTQTGQDIDAQDAVFLEECYKVFSENSKYLSVLGVSYRAQKWPNTEWFIQNHSV